MQQKKLSNKNKNLNKIFKNNLFSLIIMKEYNRSNLLLNKTSQIVYFNYFVSVFKIVEKGWVK